MPAGALVKARAALLACTLLLAVSLRAQPVRRALLIGIDDYSATTLPRVGPLDPARERGFPDLKGAANDAGILAALLVLRYGFERKNVVVLTNQQATRTAILQSLERHLVRPARRGDVVFYYFAGHGAQVPNAASDELDRLDESIVPADARRGADDIRDKELRPLFNRILNAGARLTLVLDHCHSGSSFRGLPNGARPRGIGRARAVVDAKRYGPRPDERGALVFAATQDLDPAWEARGDDGRMHGAFTWAWIRALRDAAPGEPAQETFLRAQARLRSETPYQAPAMLGPAEARLRPFLDTRVARRDGRAVVAVEKVLDDGHIVLQGGWANGLAANSELRPIGSRGTAPRLRVTKILGLGRSVARMQTANAVPPAIRSGALLEVVSWGAAARPLRIWTPRAMPNVQGIARRLAAATSARWIADPLEVTPTHVLRPGRSGWELLARDGTRTALASDEAAIAAVRRLPRAASLFVQLPAPESMDVVADDPERADYLLTGRVTGKRIEYAWIRPLVRHGDRREGTLPPHTSWTTDLKKLRADLETLRRIHAWQALESPHTAAPYRLALRHERTRELVRDRRVSGEETYSVVLRAAGSPADGDAARYYYVFVIDSHGKSHLLFPRSGSVENRFPIRAPAPPEISLGETSAFRVTPPYGLDTYVLLSTEEPLPNPSVLEWDGVRAGRALRATRWSIERVTLESVAPPHRSTQASAVEALRERALELLVDRRSGRTWWRSARANRGRGADEQQCVHRSLIRERPGCAAGGVIPLSGVERVERRHASGAARDAALSTVHAGALRPGAGRDCRAERLFGRPGDPADPGDGRPADLRGVRRRLSRLALDRARPAALPRGVGLARPPVVDPDARRRALGARRAHRAHRTAAAVDPRRARAVDGDPGETAAVDAPRRDAARARAHHRQQHGGTALRGQTGVDDPHGRRRALVGLRHDHDGRLRRVLPRDRRGARHRRNPHDGGDRPLRRLLRRHRRLVPRPRGRGHGRGDRRDARGDPAAAGGGGGDDARNVDEPCLSE
ncbi:MAG TPA: caspase family protein [Thermoanaerobaculia bacterium]|jgi:hypothetical protein